MNKFPMNRFLVSCRKCFGRGAIEVRILGMG